MGCALVLESVAAVYPTDKKGDFGFILDISICKHEDFAPITINPVESFGLYLFAGV